MRLMLTLACLAGIASPAFAGSMDMANGYGWIGAERNIDPETLGKLFCEARIKGDMSKLQAFFAPKLTNLLAQAPATTQVPWQAFPDQPKSCAIKILNGYDDTVGVLVEIDYVADARQWADTLNLERTPDSWLLNNVFYEDGGNLRFRLVSTLP
jgi:hypothetical protein